ncbi:cilia- and flagella-associated protein 251 [Punica granatum]|uniref:Uncharacterized protein n=2 Tax=Punica granatum TaxID=22663 RepID=A0A218VWX2_PUNGR|nr:cilia- and flagella-associated protein 251 [Punica granatum]OWM64769.1 hypothetical protein CDL15_Pgr028486 [Punica granatum]PKI71610.1 hypothetical protein CRG98_007933 [Punica granatum]
MLKRSTSRNQRPRGVRMKHVLQIVVLVGICFWLIYQVKYSHDKRRELSGKDAKLSRKEEDGSDVVKLGRKDLNRVADVGGQNEKHVEEEEEEEDKHEDGEEDREEEMSKKEDDQSEETEKHDEEEGQEEEEGGKEREVEDEEETKDDEPENQDKPRDEVDRDEDFIDEEKEREEESSEDKETTEDKEASEDKETAEGNEEEEEEKQGLVEDENQSLAGDEAHDEVDRSIHEAREEHYKRDDASSAVAHDNNQLISSEMEKFDLDFANESKSITNTSNQYTNGGENVSMSDGKKIEMAEKGSDLKETEAQSKDNENETDAVKVLEDSPPQNSTVYTDNSLANITATEMNTEDLSTSPPNGTETIINPPQVQNSTVDVGHKNSNATSNGKGIDSVLATPSAGTVESTNSTGTDPRAAVSDQKLSSEAKGEGGDNLRLPSNMKDSNDNNIQHLHSEPNESGEAKTG